MTNNRSGFNGSGNVSVTVRGRGRGFSMPRAVGVASLAAAGCCACWLRASDWLPTVSPGRALCLIIVCAYLVSAASLLLEDRG